MPVSKVVLHHLCDHTVVFNAKKGKRRQRTAHLKLHLKAEELLSKIEYLLLAPAEARKKKIPRLWEQHRLTKDFKQKHGHASFLKALSVL